MHSWAKGHTTEPAKGSAADTEQQTAAHGVSVAYLLGRSITISTWQPPPKKASGRKSFTPLRAEPCSGVPSPASAVCTVENAAPVYTLLAMVCRVFYQENRPLRSPHPLFPHKDGSVPPAAPAGEALCLCWAEAGRILAVYGPVGCLWSQGAPGPAPCPPLTASAPA